MRVALVHYWLVGMRGGEKVLERLCAMYPDADIFTHVHVPGSVSPAIEGHRISQSFISKLPAAGRRYKSYLPLMPMALEQLDLRGYDLVISSESGPAKGVVAPAEAVHVCYCHSPMRYAWNMYHDYRDRAGMLTRLAMPPLMHYVRNWDVATASRVHAFAANSRTVAKRLQSYYGRVSTVINPPVDLEAFSPVGQAELESHYLMVGELVRYKRPDLAVQAFNKWGKKLVVIGGGEMLEEIRRMAGPTVTVLGPQPFEVLRHHYARCEALVFPGEEDFGIVPLEAMASGRPVVAFGRGGATETVLDGTTGTFFDEQSVDAIIDACERTKAMDFRPSAAVKRAASFGFDRFEREMKTLINRTMGQYGPDRHGEHDQVKARLQAV